MDEAFLAALDAGNAANSATIERLKIAMTFVQRANADDDAMTLTGEALLMGSAFDQLFSGPSKSYELGKKFGKLLREFGNVTVAEARAARPGIEIDDSQPDRAEAQPKWWVHRKWLEELYDVRSKATHQGHHAGRPWAWQLDEHLLMAAYVFPLVVKLLLAREGHYGITEGDRDRLMTVDRLLAVAGWGEEPEDGGPARWQVVVSDVKRARQRDLLMERIKARYPDMWGDNEAPPSIDG